jgi:hypothetical protein
MLGFPQVTGTRAIQNSENFHEDSFVAASFI